MILAVEGPRHEALPQELYTKHLRLDEAPALLFAPSLPQGSAELFGGPLDFISRGSTGGNGLPRLCIPPSRDEGVRTAFTLCRLRLSYGL